MSRAAILTAWPVLLILFNPAAVFGSPDSNGPNGINSSNVAIVHGLNGAGIDIGQIDVTRPGDPGVGKDEGGGIVNSSVDPAEVFFRQSNTNFAPNYNFANEVDDHAVRVAGVMISDDFLSQGVVPEASLYSIGVNTGDVPPETQYEYVAASANHIVTHVDGLPGDRQLRAINMSILAPSDEGENPDGTSRKNGANYRESDPDNVFAFDDFVERTFPDIVAPGKDILLASTGDVNDIPAGQAGDGISFAAPHVGLAKTTRSRRLRVDTRCS